ncbi:metal-dependent hydrolase [Streptomyces fractus]|uniref:metal-dependent hydrolase n=1 Tax=Streptomyces fractus TaxID=641806 RepID=UPI003CF690D5
MGTTHAAMGAAVTTTVAAVAHRVYGYDIGAAHLAAAAVTCAGAALLPDLDHPGSTAAHALGPFTGFLARCTEWLSKVAYKLLRGPLDPPDAGAHRTLTHTLFTAAATGYGTWAAITAWGNAAALVTLFLCWTLAAYGLAGHRAHKAGTWITAIAAALAVWAVLRWAPQAVPPPLVAWSVTAGCVVHLLGDVVTDHGIPAFWPLPLRGRRWWHLCLPGPLRITTDGPVETKVVVPLCAVLTPVATWCALTSPFHH